MQILPNLRSYEKYSASAPDLSLLPKAREDVTIAGILHPALAQMLEPECHLLLLQPENWGSVLEAHTASISCLLIQPPSDILWTWEQLHAVVQQCKSRKIPTVYWDTDNSVGACDRQVFAAGFDHVLVSDPETLRVYRQENFRQAVSLLPTGVQLRQDGPVNTTHFGRKDLLLSPFELVCLRKAAEQGSCAAALETLLNGLGFPIPPRPGVTVLTATNKVDSMETIFKNYDTQTYEPRQMVVILNNDSADLSAWRDRSAQSKNVTVLQVPEALPLGRCLNEGLDHSSFAYVSKFDDDNYYAPEFLTDLVHAFSYTGAEIVGKLTYYCYFEKDQILALMCPGMENRYVTFLSGSGLLIKREVFDRIRFGDQRKGSDSVFLKECIRQGVSMFSADHFNYVYCRRSSKEQHTCKISDEALMRSCQFICHTDDFHPIVTV